MTPDSPTVSIAIRAYRRRWLGEAIGSVLEQSFSDLELVVYDDAGDLADVVSAFDDPRIRYHRAERDLGASGRFRAAVELCRGAYVGVLDDDDRYEPEFVARLLAVLEADHAAGIAFCHNVWEVGDRTYPGPDGLAPGRQAHIAREIIAGRVSIAPSRMLIRRDALDAAERYSPMPDGVAPDRWIGVHAALAGWHHVLIDDALTVCRWHPDQLTRTGSSGYDMAVRTWGSLQLGDPELEALRREHHAAALVNRALRALRQGDRRGAQADLAAAAQADPRASARRRRLAAVVAGVPGAATLASRAHRVKRRIRRRDDLPPNVGGAGRSTRQVARDAGALALGSAAAQALTVLVAPILTRLYTPADVGAASVLTGAVAFVAPLSCLRFDIAIPLARTTRATAELCAACLLAASLFTAVVALVAALFGQALCDAAGVPQMGAYVWLVPLHAAIAAVGAIGTGLLIRRRRYGDLAEVRMSQAVGQSATQLSAGVAGGGSAWFAGGVTAGAAVSSSVSAAAAWRQNRAAFRSTAAAAFRGARAQARRWRRFSTWSSGAAMLQGASVAVPAVLVTALYGPAAGGVFVLTQRVLGLPVALAMDAVGSAWFGTAAEIVRDGRGSLRAPLAAITRSLLLWGGAVLVLVMVVAPPFFDTVFGGDWHAGGQLILVLAPLHFSLFAAMPASQALQARSRTDLMAVGSAGRLAAPVAGIVGGHALGWSLIESLALYTGVMVVVSAGLALAAWRVSD